MALMNCLLWKGFFWEVGLQSEGIRKTPLGRRGLMETLPVAMRLRWGILNYAQMLERDLALLIFLIWETCGRKSMRWRFDRLNLPPAWDYDTSPRWTIKGRLWLQ